MKPGFTNFAKTKRSFTYDITSRLRTGVGEENDFGAEVSAGWWRDKVCDYAGRKSAFRSVIELTYADGTEEIIGTRTSDWQGSLSGPVLHAGIFDGEEFDARASNAARKPPMQFKPGGCERSDEFQGEILPSEGAEVVLREDLTAERAMVRRNFVVKPGEAVVVDFGQNCAAVPSFVFRAKRGTVLTALPGEMLNDADKGQHGCDGPRGSVYRANLRIPEDGMRIVYTFAGEGWEKYLPRFTYFGYRYLSITATDEVEIQSVASLPVTSITKTMEAGKIETGVADLNQFFANVYWTQLSNFLSVPTDCPQRNERLGWGADAWIYSEAGSYVADTRRFYRKWTRDMRDGRCKDGGYPSAAPQGPWGQETFNFGWADAGVIVPWTVWTMFGDMTILKENYEAMAKFVRKLDETKYDFEDHLDYIWADWLSCETFESCGNAYGNFYGKWKHDPDAKNYRLFLAACYWLNDARMMSQMAEAYGRADDAAWFRASADRALASIRGRFLERDGLLLKPMRHLQTACVFALKFGIVEGPAKKATLDLLTKSIREHGNIMLTGILGTRHLLDVLAACGETELCYTLLLQRENPSWLHSVGHGATTVWERCDGYTAERGFGPVTMNSFNHYAFGAVIGWAYRTVAGIASDPQQPGFKHIIMAPKPDRRLGYVKAEYRSQVGLIKSAWRYEGSRWIWDFTVPEGATASVTLPGETVAKTYSAGTYHIDRTDCTAAPDLFVGTQGLGHVSPAAAWPFGMVQAGPDTSPVADRYVGDWKHTCGYQHDDAYLCRFSQCRFYGIGCGTGGLLGLLPSVAPFAAGDTVPAVKMEKSSELAVPGYYAVKLESGIFCEVSALVHSAAYRFSFPKGGAAKLLVDADWGIFNFETDDADDAASFGRKVYDGAVRLTTPLTAVAHLRQLQWNDIEAWVSMAFSRPVKAKRRLNAPAIGRGEMWEYDFGELPDGTLEIRLALSTRSVLGAERNLAAEMPDFDFEGVRAKATAEWKRRLDAVTLDPATPESTRRIFESAFYRTMIHPSDLGDVGERAYSNLSLWDVFRACSPLQTIFAPEVTGDSVQSMVAIYEKQGYLPILHAFGGENHCMVGHHAVPIIVDAYLKGLGGFDAERAYAVVKDSLMRMHVKGGEGTWGLLKEDWDLLDKYGYYPFDLLSEEGRDTYHGRKVKGESVSRLLECAYDDACAAKFAAALGKKVDAAFFAKRARNWRNVYDASVGFMRGKDSRGKWREPFDPKSCGAGPWAENDFTEGNAWQYTWHVMHDVPGLVAAMGGKKKFGAKLQALFEQTDEVYGTSFTHDVSGLIGQYAHGNEPSHHVAYLFRSSDRPQKTDEYVNRICRELYKATPDGCCGNDDAGQMAAWYVFSALGFYPVDACGGEYIIGCPQVPGATLRLPNGKTFVVRVKNFSNGTGFVKSVSLNGRAIADWKICHADILKGGELVFDMRGDGRIPLVNLAAETDRQTVIAQGTEQTYQGHPTTLLADDGRTMFCVWTIGRGGKCRTTRFRIEETDAMLQPVRIDIGPCENPLSVAREKVAQLPPSAASRGIEVVFAPGEYSVTKTAVFGASDAGAPDAKIVYRAAEPGTVTFSGGVRIEPAAFRPVTDEKTRMRLQSEARDRVRVADVADLLPPLEPWPDRVALPPGPWLYANGEPLEIARWPNKTNPRGDWARFETACQTGAPEGHHKGNYSANMKPGSFYCPDRRADSWDVSAGVWLFGYWTHDWSYDILRIADVTATPTNRIVALAAPHGYGIGVGTWGTKERRYYAVNLLEELDAPGEWWLDRANRQLYLVPPEDFEKLDLRLAVLDKPFAVLDGVHDLEFRDLDFAYSHTPGVALELKGDCQRVVFDGCSVRCLGGTGVELNGRNNVFRNGQVLQAGAGGVRLRGGDRKTLTRADNVVENTEIGFYGRFVRTYAAGVDFQGVGQTVRGCRIHDAPHNAILYGGNDNLIQSNEIYRVLLETGDAGAVYTGRDTSTLGNVIEGNSFHDLGGDEELMHCTMGIYFDDCDWGDAVIGNVFERLGTAVFIGGGNLHPVIGNTMCDCAVGVHIDSRGITWQKTRGGFLPNAQGESWAAQKLKPFAPNAGVWHARYPELTALLADRPELPRQNMVSNNVFIACKAVFSLDPLAQSVTNECPFVDNHISDK